MLRRYLLEGINTHLLIPIDDLSWLSYGPPVEFHGIILSPLDARDMESSPYNEMLPVFALFGLTANQDDLDTEMDRALCAARLLDHTLQERPESIYRDLAKLLQWMFSFSGNTAIDYVEEAFWEMGAEYADWDEEDIAMINEINQEAKEFMNSAMDALHQLKSDPTLRKALNRNIKAVFAAIDKKSKQKGQTTRANAYYFNTDECAALNQCARWPERT